MPARNGGRSRRDFFYLAGTIAAGITSGQDRGKTVESASPQIGILIATTFTTGTLEERLDAARACGLACVQMSMVCANLPEMPDQIPAGLPAKIRGCGTAPDGVAAATGAGRGMRADGDILH